MTHVALGYRWYPASVAYHFERALRQLGHTVTYMGLPTPERPGFDSSVSVATVLDTLQPKPDLFLWIDPAGHYFPRDIETAPIPTACYLVDVHLGTWRLAAARFFDAVFIAQRDYLDAYRQAAGHEQVYWLPLAAAPDVHRDWQLERGIEVGFVGNLARAHRQTARARRLKLLAEQFKTNDFYRPYSPEEVGRTYSQSRIVVNTSIAGDVTMRVFEGAACGALVLTDATANGLDTLFNVGDELVAYADDADLLDKATYYLAHDDERARIAQAGQRRVLAQHTYAHRAQAILDIVTAPGFSRNAPMQHATPAQAFETRRIIYTRLHMLDELLDHAQAVGVGRVRRAWMSLPCLARKLRL